MATKSAHHLLSSIILLLFLNVVPNTAHLNSNVNPFGFIKNLEGCKKGQNVEGLHHLKSYLAKFGYLEPLYYHPVPKIGVNTTSMTIQKDDQLFDDSLEKAIRTYQLNYRLNVSGHLDAATVQQMMKPRCGFADIINGKNTMQREDKKIGYKSRKSMYGTSLYALIGRRWPSYQLTYQVQSQTLVSGAENMRYIVAQQLYKWAQYSPFTFQEVPEGSQSDLVFGFAQGDHGDGYPFDGIGGILAHSFSPSDGRSHYDATEYWSDNPGQHEMDLNSVVLHEIGHLLGLAHTQDPTAVMHSGISPGERKRFLQEDDVEGIQAIYG
ncbi:metalloendoproteinase 2-MMP [Beta vulgaris subsp. vulgaris]|uniref:metalloendoproteinase 2-MMP n=1 Tax=Beta vulgaris subsp. vulgaris TaxID=3555 RepID=UPI002036C349|nr:metalloendoproteinase 2-MMP [Beta vulgaris subsp. vulgaris]